MNCKICDIEVNINHAIPVKDFDVEYYICGLSCFMKWLVEKGEVEDYNW